MTQAALAQSIAPLHVIGRSFNTTNPGQLSWLAAGYSLTVGTFILPAGRWGDLYGHKLLFIIGYFWFALWSLVAGITVYSHSLVFFAFCRGMQGIGPAILLPNGVAILTRTYPPGPRKNMVLSIFGATAPSGFVIGAVFSGIFTQFVWWPWAYWVMAMALTTIGVLALLVIPRMPVQGPRATFEELDAIGTVVGVVGLIFFNFAWNQGPAAGWGKVYVYVLLILGVILLVVFFWLERHRASHPLVPMSLLTVDTKLVFGCEAFGWMSFGIWVFYLWWVSSCDLPLASADGVRQILELERGHSILLSTAQLSPTCIAGCLAAIMTGFLIAKIQSGWIMLISMSAFLTGNILLATMPVRQTYCRFS
jgi:MFS family permease